MTSSVSLVEAELSGDAKRLGGVGLLRLVPETWKSTTSASLGEASLFFFQTIWIYIYIHGFFFAGTDKYIGYVRK